MPGPCLPSLRHEQWCLPPMASGMFSSGSSSQNDQDAWPADPVDTEAEADTVTSNGCWGGIMKSLCQTHVNTPQCVPSLHVAGCRCGILKGLSHTDSDAHGNISGDTYREDLQRPCAPDFMPGTKHLKNRFCAVCRLEGFSISWACARVATPALAVTVGARPQRHRAVGTHTCLLHPSRTCTCSRLHTSPL